MDRRRARRGRTEEVLDVRLDLFDQPFHTQVAVTTGSMRLADIVPVARRVCDRLVELVLTSLRRTGRDVPCRVGCSACCRYLVPLSPPEAFGLLGEIQSMPPRRRQRVLEAFRGASRRLHEAALSVPPCDEQPPGSGPADPAAPTEAERWYARLELDCPLLANGLCSAYPVRPLACRSYFAASDPKYCRDLASGLGRRLGLPVSFVQALSEVTAEVEGSTPQAVPLPMAPLWAADQQRRARRRRPARDLMRRLVRILNEQARRAAQRTGRIRAA